jgi:Mob1/phocein family
MQHNLDYATASLQNQKLFPSRFSISDPGMRVLQTVLKRVCRIVAHCALYHKESFLELEEETSLGARFYTFLSMFGFEQSIPSNSLLREYTSKKSTT